MRTADGSALTETLGSAEGFALGFALGAALGWAVILGDGLAVGCSLMAAEPDAGWSRTSSCAPRTR